MTYEESVIRDTLSRLIVDPSHVFELRAIQPCECVRECGMNVVIGGWYDDLERLAFDAFRLDRSGAIGVYLTLNPVDPCLLARGNNRLQSNLDNLTTDADITRRYWLPLDFDPVRPAGTSATTAERNAVKPVLRDAVAWLENTLGTSYFVQSFSGNGYHLLVPIDLPNNDETTSFVRDVINAAADRFDSPTVKVNRSIFDAAHVSKLYGTMVRKGDAMPRLDRVHRRSMILSGLKTYSPGDHKHAVTRCSTVFSPTPPTA